MPPTWHRASARRSNTRAHLLALTCAAALSFSAQAWAQSSVSVATHTIGVGREMPILDASDTRSRVTFYQYVELATEELGVEGLQIDFSGFAGVDVADQQFNGLDNDSRIDGNVITGLLRWQDRKNRIALALGRQYLFLGAGRAEHLDGLSVTYRLPWHLDVEVFGGRTEPWQLDYDVDDARDPHVSREPFAYSNWAAGGRLRYRLLDRGVAALGFIHESDGDETVRQNLTFQAGYWSSPKLETLAGGVVDTVYGRPQELWLTMISRWDSKLKLTADYNYQVPSLTIPKTSIFSVFATDDYHAVRLGAYYAFTSCLWAELNGGPRVYTGGDETETGYSASGTVRLSFGPERRGLVGLRSELIDAGDQWSLQNRIFASYRFGMGLYGNLEGYLLYLGSDREGVLASDYERRINDEPLSLGTLAVAGYQITPALSAQLATSAFVTPLAENDVRVFGRLTYRGFWSWGR